MEVECLIGFVLPTFDFCTFIGCIACTALLFLPFLCAFIPSLRAFYSVPLRIFFGLFS